MKPAKCKHQQEQWKKKKKVSKKSLSLPNKGPRKEVHKRAENLFGDTSPTPAKHQWINIPTQVFSQAQKGASLPFPWQPQGNRSALLIYPAGGVGRAEQGANLLSAPSRSRQCPDFPALELSVGLSGELHISFHLASVKWKEAVCGGTRRSITSPTLVSAQQGAELHPTWRQWGSVSQC